MLGCIHWVKKLAKFLKLNDLICISIKTANHGNDLFVQHSLTLHGQELFNISVIEKTLPCNVHALESTMHAPVVFGVQMTFQRL